MRKCLAAFTPNLWNYPPYVNITDAGDGIEVTVRAPAVKIMLNGKEVDDTGHTACIKLSYEEWAKLIAELKENTK